MDGNIHQVSLDNFSDHVLALGSDAHYSPDFNYITYIDPDNTSFDLLNLKTNSKQNIKTTGNFGSVSQPELSPDGTKIIFIGSKAVY